MATIKNISAIVRKTKSIDGNLVTRIPLYYSIRESKAFTESGEDRCFVTYLIRPQSGDEIKAAINRWLNM
jgi:hypothetical protein